jgi:hypothetical protein
MPAIAAERPCSGIISTSRFSRHHTSFAGPQFQLHERIVGKFRLDRNGDSSQSEASGENA